MSRFRLGLDPQLTTIQDILYKADGSRFNGILTINWGSFQSTDSANIVMQSVTVKVVTGICACNWCRRRRPVAYYTVVYNSDGRCNFRRRGRCRPARSRSK